MRTATVTAALRVGLGLALLGRPELLTRPLGIDAVTSAKVSWLARMLGGRDAGVGIGALVALRGVSRGKGSARGWLLASALADGTDAAALAIALRRRQVNPLTGLAVIIGAALGTAASLGAVAKPPLPAN